MRKNKWIYVLGTKYEIIINAPDKMLPPGADGAMDHSTKKIIIAKFKPDEYSVKELKNYRKKVLRHEIVHAFCMNQDCGITAEIYVLGHRARKSQIGLPFNRQSFSVHSKKLIVYEYKPTGKCLFQRSRS